MNALQRDILYSERNSTKSTRQWVITRKYVQVCTNSTSNQFAVYLEVLGCTWRFAVYNSTNRGINSTEFIIPAAVQYILPLIQTELTDAGYNSLAGNIILVMNNDQQQQQWSKSTLNLLRDLDLWTTAAATRSSIQQPSMYNLKKPL